MQRDLGLTSNQLSQYLKIERLAELCKDGQLTPVIDRTFPLSEAADAIRYLEAGRARGKIAIAV